MLRRNVFAAPSPLECIVLVPPLALALRTATVPLLALGCFLVSLAGLGFAQSADTTTPPVTTLPSSLGATYAAHRATAHAGADRQFLTYDPTGRGLVTEVFGDLATARTLAVAVGGVGTDLTTFEDGTLRAGARALAAADPAAAVVAWADYVSPAGLGPSAAESRLATVGGQRLRTFLDSLARGTSADHVVLVCHSYGSAVCAAALADGSAHGVADVVDLASPGVGDGELPAGVRRWAAVGPADPIRFVPHVAVAGFGLGKDPTGLPGVHELPVPADGDHDGYLVPGSPTLDAVADVLSA